MKLLEVGALARSPVGSDALDVLATSDYGCSPKHSHIEMMK